jgi:hypothetical protein
MLNIYQILRHAAFHVDDRGRRSIRSRWQVSVPAAQGILHPYLPAHAERRTTTDHRCRTSTCLPIRRGRPDFPGEGYHAVGGNGRRGSRRRAVRRKGDPFHDTERNRPRGPSDTTGHHAPPRRHDTAQTPLPASGNGNPTAVRRVVAVLDAPHGRSPALVTSRAGPYRLHHPAVEFGDGCFEAGDGFDVRQSGKYATPISSALAQVSSARQLRTLCRSNIGVAQVGYVFKFDPGVHPPFATHAPEINKIVAIVRAVYMLAGGKLALRDYGIFLLRWISDEADFCWFVQPRPTGDPEWGETSIRINGRDTVLHKDYPSGRV